MKVVKGFRQSCLETMKNTYFHSNCKQPHLRESKMEFVNLGLRGLVLTLKAIVLACFVFKRDKNTRML